jgi:hypothetical protein
VALPVDGPAAVVGVEDGDLRVDGGAVERGAGFGELFAYVGDLGVDGSGCAVGSDEGSVELLLAVEGGAPLPVADGVSAVADVVPCHGADLALVERGVDGLPVDEAGLSLHDPEIFSQEAASEVVGGSVGIRVEVAATDVVVP